MQWSALCCAVPLLIVAAPFIVVLLGAQGLQKVLRACLRRCPACGGRRFVVGKHEIFRDVEVGQDDGGYACCGSTPVYGSRKVIVTTWTCSECGTEADRAERMDD